jgi:hypothetical protein
MNYKAKLFPRVDCSCGKTVYKYYLEKLLKTNTHKLNNSTDAKK